MLHRLHFRKYSRIQQLHFVESIFELLCDREIANLELDELAIAFEKKFEELPEQPLSRTRELRVLPVSLDYFMELFIDLIKPLVELLVLLIGFRDFEVLHSLEDLLQRDLGFLRLEALEVGILVFHHNFVGHLVEVVRNLIYVEEAVLHDLGYVEDQFRVCKVHHFVDGSLDRDEAGGNG